MEKNSLEKKYNPFIVAISILIPVVVAVLFNIKLKDVGCPVEPMPYLPPIYAFINGLTAVVLVSAIVAIKNKKRVIHERLMTIAITLSLLFLVLYVVYHMTTDSTKYGGDGVLKYVYYYILFSHIFLSIAVIPMVLTAYIRALSERFDSHKKIAKITFPIWLYVTVTGVIVYYMIAPYYV